MDEPYSEQEYAYAAFASWVQEQVFQPKPTESSSYMREIANAMRRTGDLDVPLIFRQFICPTHSRGELFKVRDRRSMAQLYAYTDNYVYFTRYDDYPGWKVDWVPRHPEVLNEK